jgi:hypothetical protein
MNPAMYAALRSDMERRHDISENTFNNMQKSMSAVGSRGRPKG